MTFLSPLLLWFLLAASVPIAIHFLNKRRHKTVPWAAMQFLLKATRESRGKKKLRHILILTCRALGVTALTLAAAKPLVSGLLGWGAGKVDTVVLILDRSPSMELRQAGGQPSKRERVLQKVRDSIAKIDNPRLILIDSATAQAQEVPSPDVLAEISTTAPSDSMADIPALMSVASSRLSTQGGRSELWIASDLQASNWQPEQKERWDSAKSSLISLPQKPALRILSLTGNSTANTAIRLLDSRRTTAGLTLSLEFLRSQDQRSTLNLPLKLELNGSTSSETIQLTGQSLNIQKHIPIQNDTESGYGWLSLPADGNDRDNTVFFAYGSARPLKTLIVATLGDTADYLNLAAAPPNFENQSATRIEPSQFTNTAIADFSLILWASPLPTLADQKILETYLSNGGQILCLPSGLPSETSFLGQSWGNLFTTDAGKFFYLKNWDRKDGPLKDGNDGTPIPADRLRAIRRVIPQGDANQLASWEDGEPFLSRKIINKGTLWMISSIPDYTWSNLGDADVLLPLTQRILQEGARRFDASCLGFVGLSEYSKLSGMTRVDSVNKGNSTELAGVFRISDQFIALNRPKIEDGPEIISKESLDELLAETNYTLLDQTGQSSDPNDTTDLWRAFLVAMLCLLFIEAFLCLPKKNPIEKALPRRNLGKA